jgi:adenosylcobinamide amidohydrolase
LPLLVWRFAAPRVVASTAAVGSGVGEREWVINAQVARGYARHDLASHGAELAAATGLSGSGVVMFTAAHVSKVQHAIDGGVEVHATVGLSDPTWAAAPDGADDGPVAPGTINVVAFVPVSLAPGALLNALTTVAEAKAQALAEGGVPGTGTPSDAVTITCPAGAASEPFGGPRSVWGARLARATHAAISAGIPDTR